MKDDLFDYGLTYEKFEYFLKNIEEFNVNNDYFKFVFNEDLKLFLQASYCGWQLRVFVVCDIEDDNECYIYSDGHYCLDSNFKHYSNKELNKIYNQMIQHLNTNGSNPIIKNYRIAKTEKRELEELISNTTNSGGKNERRFI